MSDLTAAVKENTVSKLQEANFLLAAQLGMSEILNDSEKVAAISTDAANLETEQLWLADMVKEMAQEGYDVKNLGIAGLTLETDFSKLDEKQTTDMIA
jgi:hypothetical protein